MKATIKRPDGTVIELEGTAEELAPLIAAPPQYVPIWLQPAVHPPLPPLNPFPSPWFDIYCQQSIDPTVAGGGVPMQTRYMTVDGSVELSFPLGQVWDRVGSV